MDYAIETHGLVKCYGSIRAVDGLDLRVARGQVYAFLGLNGAGKTTTIRLLLGMIAPSSGEVCVLGRPIQARKTKPWDSVGYLVETANSYPELTVRENVELSRRLRPRTLPRATDHIIEQLGLSQYRDRRAGTLSLGNIQRLGLAKALLHRPELVLLDEPSNGLDPAGIVEIRNLLIGLARDEGTTVFMSSHILAEVSRLADRVGIIHRGRLVQELSAAELDQSREKRLTIRTRDLECACGALAAAGFSPRLNAHGEIELQDGSAIDRPDSIATLLVNAGHPPLMLNVKQEELERYFLRLVGMEQGVAG